MYQTRIMIWMAVSLIEWMLIQDTELSNWHLMIWVKACSPSVRHHSL